MKPDEAERGAADDNEVNARGADASGADGFAPTAAASWHSNSRWTVAAREDFLAALSASCNVAAAARAAGVSHGMVYRLRRHDDGFAAEWQAALACGYDLLETSLVGHALAGGTGTTLTGGDPDLPAIDVELALKLLTTHRQRAERGQPRVGQRPKIATREEVNAALLAKLDEAEARVRAAKARRAQAKRAASRTRER